MDSRTIDAHEPDPDVRAVREPKTLNRLVDLNASVVYQLSLDSDLGRASAARDSSQGSRPDKDVEES